MTHFSPSVSALPLSPLLVVKFDHILSVQMLIDFWSFFGVFWSIMTDFSEKLDFYIKNRDFWVIFVIKFKWKLINFVSFFDPFLGFLGG